MTFVYVYKLPEKLQMTLLDYIDFGKSPGGHMLDEGLDSPGFVIKDSKGYIFVKGMAN